MYGFSSAKTLVISFIGMENKEVPIKPSVKVTLKPMTELLSEVLVTGTYGSAKKLGSMVGSVAAVKSEKIANRPTLRMPYKDRLPAYKFLLLPVNLAKESLCVYVVSVLSTLPANLYLY